VADGLITRRSSQGRVARSGARDWLRLRYRLTPWWARVLAIFALSRVISTALLLGFARVQENNPWTLAHPDYASYARIWDGQWYYIVAQLGYPSVLPVTGDGHIGQNQWAFLPVYPELVKIVSALSGAQFGPAAIFVSVAAAAGAALVFYKLMRRSLPEGSSLFAVVLFCVAPLSPLLQVAYAEALFLLLLAVALLLLLQRRYWWMLLVIAVASFTRPGVVAFALALALHWGYRWWTRAKDPFSRTEQIRVAVVAVATGVLGLAWPAIAAIATGRLTAYTDTELSWRADYIGYGKLLPFTSWVQGANWWFPGGSGVIYLVVALVLFGLFLASPWARRLPVDLRLWVISYVVYLLAVFFPQSSTFRVLMPVFPLLGALAVPRSKLFRLGLVCLCIVGQYFWLYYCWWVNGYDWTPP
jgi:Gpi18-like mannosyltransferase